MVVVPLLTLAFGVDIRYAIGASLVSVIATSSGAAAAYVREGFSNIRVGMFLEIATTIGAISGAVVAAYLKLSWIAITFGLVIYSACRSVRSLQFARPNTGSHRVPAPSGRNLSHVARHPVLSRHKLPPVRTDVYSRRHAQRLGHQLPGAVKVLAMDRAMKLPFKVSTTTSNFMIGVTAAASAGVYLNRGYIDPGLAMPVMLGVLGGSLTGARLLAGAKVKVLRIVFSTVVALLGLEMIFNGFVGKFVQ